MMMMMKKKKQKVRIHSTFHNLTFRKGPKTLYEMYIEVALLLSMVFSLPLSAFS